MLWKDFFFYASFQVSWMVHAIERMLKLNGRLGSEYCSSLIKLEEDFYEEVRAALLSQLGAE